MIFNGIDILDVDRAITVAKEIPPGSPTRELQVVQGLGGTIFTGTLYGQGTYIVRVNIAGKSRAKAWEVRNKLAVWAYTESPARLIPTHWPGVYYDAICGGISAPEFTFGFGVVECTFTIPRPYAISLCESVQAFPGGGEYRFGGDVAARPAVSQALASAGQSVTWSMDGLPFFRLNGDFKAGNTILVDFAYQSVIWNGQHAENLVDYTASRWFPGFGPGARIITSSDSGDMTIRWRNEWM